MVNALAVNWSKWVRTPLEGILLWLMFTFFLELLPDFIGAIYNLNLLTTSLTKYALGILFLLAPLILMAFRNKFSRLLPAIAGEGLVVCRIVGPLLNVFALMLVEGAGVAFFLIFFPSKLYQMAQNGSAQKGSSNLGWGLAGGLLTVIAFRSFGSSLDVAMNGTSQWMGWVLTSAPLFSWQHASHGRSRSATRWRRGSFVKQRSDAVFASTRTTYENCGGWGRSFRSWK